MLRIGVAQIHNHFNYDANLRCILSAMDSLANQGADLVLFPECAVTGFNTGLRKIDSEELARCVREVQARAKKARISVALPTPWLRDDGRFTNSVLLISDQGEVQHRFHKIGFQQGEERLFSPGISHSRCFDVKGHRVGVLICIEASLGPWDYLSPADPPDVILWPGFFGIRPGESWSDSYSKEDRNVRRNLEQWRTPLIQANCASSPESSHWPDFVFGRSVALGSDGKEVFSARPEAEELLVVSVNGRTVRGANSAEGYWKAART